MCEAEGVNGSALRVISPYVSVRLESALAGCAVHASPAIDDAQRTAVCARETT